MRIELTITGPDGSQDVAVVAPPAAPFGALAHELAAVAGIPAGEALWADDRLLAPDVSLADSGLRTGSLLTAERPDRAPMPSGVPSLHIISGPAAGRSVPLGRGRQTIGRDPGCTLVLADDAASRMHAEVVVGSTSMTLHDLSSTNGTRVDGVEVGARGVRLRPEQVIRIGDSLLAIGRYGDAPAALVAAAEAILVNRAPRQPPAVPNCEIELPLPTDSPRPRRVQWVTAALPAVAGGAIALVMHAPQFLLFALLSPVMMVSSSLGDRVHWRRSRRREAATYRRRRAETDRKITEGLAAETSARRCSAPDAVALSRSATTPTSRLWERRRFDSDYLSLRLGSADLPSILRVRSGSSVVPAGTAHAAPLCVDLRAGPLGLAGPSDIVAGLARWLIAQLAVLHSPGDVELALLLSAEGAPGWTWARWLPHLGDRVAICPDEWQSLIADLTAVVEQRRAVLRLDPRGWSGT
ncbi:MAG: segregation ATPase FtsK/SpoIIIE, family, partial [Pseudonocardiales bacterium]|nr:segregation ATPase FtsK/SpoIIIE, family [Pseudonocardiales bacterium]